MKMTMPKTAALFFGILILIIGLLYASGMGKSAEYGDASFGGRSTVFISTEEAVGSGVYIGEGYILTANHVVENEDGSASQSIHIRTQLGAIRTATIMFVNPDMDIALLKTTEDINIDVSELACDGPYSGPVDLQGYPLGLGYSESTGNISDEIITTFNSWDAVVIVSAQVIQGMSGGPALDKDGRIVGIIVGLVLGGEGQNVGLVVPASKVCELFPSH